MISFKIGLTFFAMVLIVQGLTVPIEKNEPFTTESSFTKMMSVRHHELEEDFTSTSTMTTTESLLDATLKTREIVEPQTTKQPSVEFYSTESSSKPSSFEQTSTDYVTDSVSLVSNKRAVNLKKDDFLEKLPTTNDENQPIGQGKLFKAEYDPSSVTLKADVPNNQLFHEENKVSVSEQTSSTIKPSQPTENREKLSGNDLSFANRKNSTVQFTEKVDKRENEPEKLQTIVDEKSSTVKPSGKHETNPEKDLNIKKTETGSKEEFLPSKEQQSSDVKHTSGTLDQVKNSSVTEEKKSNY